MYMIGQTTLIFAPHLVGADDEPQKGRVWNVREAIAHQLAQLDPRNLHHVIQQSRRKRKHKRLETTWREMRMT